MGKLILAGLGISGRELSIGALETIRSCDFIFLEKYTSPAPKISLKWLKETIGKEVKEVGREKVEGNFLLRLAEGSSVALLCGGDPLTATTHVSLAIEGRKRGIDVKIFHSSSIYTAAPAACGLQIYKFGRTTTIPKPSKNYFPESPYFVLKENLERGLHTLVLLDTLEGERTLRVDEGIKILMELEKKIGEGVISEEMLVIGLSDLGTEKEFVRAGRLGEIVKEAFPGSCQSIIFPGKLHFVEVEALKILAGASEDLLPDEG